MGVKVALAVIIFLLGAGGVSYYYSKRAPVTIPGAVSVNEEKTVAVQVQKEKATMEKNEQQMNPVAVESHQEARKEEPEKEQSRIRIVPLEISE